MRNKKYYRTGWNISWEEISETLSVKEETLKQLNPKLINIKVLNKGTIIVYPGRALNVSYSEEGLKWTANKLGKLLYFEDAFLIQKDGKPTFQGKNLKRSKNIFVEEFVPMDHKFNNKILIEDQKAEFLWINKGIRLLYSDISASPMEHDSIVPNVEIVEVI